MLRLNTAEGNRRFSHAFSLIEVLVAMAIMIVIVVMVTNMFRDASGAWDSGTQRAEMNTAARAALEYIARELSSAVAGSIPDSQGGTATLKPFILTGGDNLSFTALSGEDQALRGVSFKYDNYDIKAARDETGGPYDSMPPAYYTFDYQLLITNVWSFQAFAYENEDDLRTGTYQLDYNSSANSDLLPACVDISIEMLNERDMARALSPGVDPNFVMKNSRVYTTRVCFPNRGGR